MSEKFRLDRKIGFRNTFYTKCINVIIDSIGPSIILRRINRLYTVMEVRTPQTYLFYLIFIYLLIINCKSFQLLNITLMTANSPYPIESTHSVHLTNAFLCLLMSHLRYTLYKC